ncbi:MAG: sulfatase-like hydrolase/transferase [Spirochaetaceae bacterium]|nr:sulfatase-like hydrolase/transferase [Spirochaetaceae bacterium]
MTGGAAATRGGGSGRPPHIVVILSDQLRADCVGCYGNPIIRTPHVDALAAAGTRFAQAFSQHPQCAPSRASILTSRYPHVNGSTSNYVAVGDHELTLPEYLRALGYHTAGTGKLHLSDAKLAAFDELIQSEGQRSGATDPEVLHPHYKAWLKANGHWQTAVEAFAMHGRPEYLEGFRAAVNPLPEHAYFDGWVGDRTVELIRRHPAEQPLFLFMGLPNPHIPFDAPEPYASMYDPESLPLPPTFGTGLANKPPQHLGYKRHGRKEDFEDLDEAALRRVTALYYGSISLVDAQVGKVMAALAERGMLEDTVVAFLSDHGELLGHFGMLIKSIDEYPMLYDVGLHVPLIIRPPGGEAGRVVDEPVELVDLAPTLLSCAGLEVPPEMQGTSQRSALFGGEPARREYVFAESGPVKMVRGERYKLVHYPGQPYGELYDLQRDPHEADNRFDDPDLAPQRERLTRALLDRLIAAEGPLHGESERGPAYWRRQYRLPFESEA